MPSLNFSTFMTILKHHTGQQHVSLQLAHVWAWRYKHRSHLYLYLHHSRPGWGVVVAMWVNPGISTLPPWVKHPRKGAFTPSAQRPREFRGPKAGPTHHCFHKRLRTQMTSPLSENWVPKLAVCSALSCPALIHPSLCLSIHSSIHPLTSHILHHLSIHPSFIHSFISSGPQPLPGSEAKEMTEPPPRPCT